jgi:hypothetical protein
MPFYVGTISGAEQSRQLWGEGYHVHPRRDVTISTSGCQTVMFGVLSCVVRILKKAGQG